MLLGCDTRRFVYALTGVLLAGPSASPFAHALRYCLLGPSASPFAHVLLPLFHLACYLLSEVLRRRAVMPRHVAFYQWRDAIANHFPGLTRPQVYVLALWAW